MRIISWNINSVRLRTALVKKCVQKYKPDILCLQEIKCHNDDFPDTFFHRLGYKHISKNGIKGYHGVAIASRRPFMGEKIINFCGREDGRYNEVIVKYKGAPLAVHNFYVPAGGDVPNRKLNEKFGHKLDFLAEMEAMFKKRRDKKTAKRVLLGDLNIAPFEHDVWSSKQLRDVVSHTDIERETLSSVQAAYRWQDISRQFVPEAEKLYSWWSYRARDWRASNRGRRLDHIWTSESLNKAVKHFNIITQARGWKQPSDHVPVILDLA